MSAADSMEVRESAFGFQYVNHGQPKGWRCLTCGVRARDEHTEECAAAAYRRVASVAPFVGVVRGACDHMGEKGGTCLACSPPDATKDYEQKPMSRPLVWHNPEPARNGRKEAEFARLMADTLDAAIASTEERDARFRAAFAPEPGAADLHAAAIDDGAVKAARDGRG